MATPSEPVICSGCLGEETRSKATPLGIALVLPAPLLVLSAFVVGDTVWQRYPELFGAATLLSFPLAIAGFVVGKVTVCCGCGRDDMVSQFEPRGQELLARKPQAQGG